MRKNFLIALTTFAVLYSLSIAILFINQAPLEHHAFRQTQTALTAYWLKINGFSLQYETPVFGFPWSIPMEFPIYQLLVAYVSKFFNISLDLVGRGISYFFLLACLFPIYRITNYLKLSRATFLFFIPIFLTQPIYLYWGRTFMIETTALFFSLMSVGLFLDCLNGGRSLNRLLALFIFASLGMLQKITTALPILLVVVFTFLYVERNRISSFKKIVKDLRLISVGITLFLAVCTAYLWISYSDGVKWQRGWDGVLTSHSLNAWNWGTLEQRFSYALWIKVIGGRIFARNLGAVIGLGLIFFLFYSAVDPRIKRIGYVLLALSFAPLAIFTNLHIVHDYYQVANIVFLTFLVALSLSYAVLPKYGKNWAYSILVVLIIVNGLSGIKYINLMRLSFDLSNRDVIVGQVLNNELTPNQQFVAFGNDWSSTFSYLSQRKSFTAPTWFKDYQTVMLNPENYVEPNHLGAIVSCGSEGPTLEQMQSYKLQGEEIKIAEVGGCYFLTKSKTITQRNIMDSRCNAAIADPAVIRSSEKEFLRFSGRANSVKPENSLTMNEIYMQITNSTGQKKYYQLTRVPSQMPNENMSQDNKFFSNFSGIFSKNEFGQGVFIADLVYGAGNQYLSCGLNKRIEIK